MHEKKIFPLSKLTQAIENVINTHCNKIVWVKAEIVKLNYYTHSGHCYPDLVEKKNGKIISELRGNIWKKQFDIINGKFKEVLQEELKDNMTVVIQAKVTYHSVYGLALNIIDIDPEYTLGELAKQKAETLKRLQEEQLLTANKKTVLPLLPKTIAIISVDTSKGYQDFINVIKSNEWGYEFLIHLFPAILQGERAVKTISQQLDRIQEHSGVFDAVAIIRGGGGEIGLSCYDNYHLAKKIAQFPVPVLTGIGHATNETVCELVSYRSFITPTKIAEFLLQEFHNFAFPLKENIDKLKTQINRIFDKEQTSLRETSRLFHSFTGRSLDRNKNQLEQIKHFLISSSRATLEREKSTMENLATSIHFLSPETTLKRGYSISRINGKVIRDVQALKSGDKIETQVYNGKLYSRLEAAEIKTEE